MIERHQRRATKLVPTISNCDYEERLDALSLTTLADRRLREDAIQCISFFFFFYFIHGSPESSDFSLGLLLTPHPGTMR